MSRGRLGAAVALLLPAALTFSGGTPAPDALKADPGAAAASWSWTLPRSFPPPRVPADNPMSAAKVELGRALFYDRRLSRSGEMSCATCHRPELAFSDGRPRAVGITGELHPRSAPSLAGVAYAATLNWDDPAPASLERQLLTPLLGHEPIEMGNERSSELIGRLRSDLVLGWQFAAAFPGEEEPLHLENLARAIAAFERTLISGNSAFDRWAYGGEEQALSPGARRGLALFHSARVGCGDCHGRFTFSGPIVYQDSRDAEGLFYNTGLYDLDGKYPAENPGLARHTLDVRDDGRFRPPTLRNVAVTAPYMHDGSLPTLEAVIRHYESGGRSHPGKDSRMHAFVLTEPEREDLTAFLESLTDEEFLTDPRFGPPDLRPPVSRSPD